MIKNFASTGERLNNVNYLIQRKKTGNREWHRSVPHEERPMSLAVPVEESCTSDKPNAHHKSDGGRGQ